MREGWALTESFPWKGFTVRWDRFGEGPPVVLSHGTPWSSYVWRSTVDRLAGEWTVYMWDMLGYGQSDKPDADVSIAEQGRILAALVDHWQVEAPHLIAHDIGGAVALRAHLLHQVPAGSLALVDVVALRPWGSPFFRLVRDHPQVFSALPPALHQALVREYIGGTTPLGFPSEVHQALVAPWLGEEGQAGFYRQIAQADERYTDEVEPLYPSIGVPTLIGWGTEDPWIPVERAHQLHRLIPGSELELIPGAGHLPQEDQPERLNQLLADWLTKLG